MKIRLIISCFLCFTFIATCYGQKRTTVDQAKIQASKGQWLGKTKAVRDLVPMKATDPNKRAKQKLNKKQVPNFIGRGKHGEMKIGALPLNEDPVRQKSAFKSADREPEILVNIQGMGQGSPTDPTGDIGKDYYIQMVNSTRWQIFDKSGNEVTNPMNLSTLWAPLGQSSFGDPIVIYDQDYERWILTEFAPFNANMMLVAVSETSDPTGAYNVYGFSTPSFPDYPKYSLWTNAICITTNETGNGSHTSYFIEREDLINGEVNPDIQRISLPGQPGGPGFFVSTPVDWSGQVAPPQGSSPIIVGLSDDAWGNSAQDQIDMFHINLDFNNPDNTTVDQESVITAPFQTGDVCQAPGPNFACIPQPNGLGIDGLPETIMNQVHYRNYGNHESIVLNFIVNPDIEEPLAGIRWMELRKTQDSDWSVYQEGTFSPEDGENRFMAGIAQDGRGNILMSYVVSSLNTFPSIRAVGRYSSDPLGMMSTGEIEIVTGVSSGPAGRFGDYSQMSVDPVDDKTFWHTSEYLGSGGDARTRIFSAQFEQDSIDFEATSLITPKSSSFLGMNEQVTMRIRNDGLTTQQDFEVGYSFEGGTEVSEMVNMSLDPGDSYDHTFTQTVDFDDIRDYQFRLFVTLENDTFQLNDTVNAVVTKIPEYDASISNIIVDNNICDSIRNIDINITNLGGLNLTELNLEITINGIATNETFIGNLPYAETTNYIISNNELLDGLNDIEVRCSMPNGQADQNMVNDVFNTSFEALTNSVTVNLEILTDDFPNETTWEIFNAENALIYSGGPYSDESTLYIETLCLDPDGCYTMAIYDTYSDGICCGFGEGTYQIISSDNAPLLIGNGDFGSSATDEFCATFLCLLDADINLSAESNAGAQDGLITIQAMNAPSELMYSIDGGLTFQGANFFGGLSAGSYDIVVMAEFDCIYTETIELTACALDVIIEVIDESVKDLGDGAINFDVMGGNDPLSYSIDGGLNFQDSPEFPDLTNGIYEVFIQDALGCAYQDTVEVSYLTSTSEPTQELGYQAMVLPNPTEGVFKVLLNYPSNKDVLTGIEIINMEGKQLRRSSIAKWNGVYEGSFSLVTEPDGMYFVRFKDRRINKMLKVIKQSK